MLGKDFTTPRPALPPERPQSTNLPPYEPNEPQHRSRRAHNTSKPNLTFQHNKIRKTHDTQFVTDLKLENFFLVGKYSEFLILIFDKYLIKFYCLRQCTSKRG